MKQYTYTTQDYHGIELSAPSLYGLAGLRSLILDRWHYCYDGQLVYRYMDGVMDLYWVRIIHADDNGVSFSRL